MHANETHFCHLHSGYRGATCPICRRINYQNDEKFWIATDKIRRLFAETFIGESTLNYIIDTSLHFPLVEKWIEEGETGLFKTVIDKNFRLFRMKEYISFEIKTWIEADLRGVKDVSGNISQ
jgi:hypothetical protein